MAGQESVKAEIAVLSVGGRAVAEEECDPPGVAPTCPKDRQNTTSVILQKSKRKLL